MTRERLILVAEELFGERGIDSVTMRMICDAAGQKNMGAVQYYFGDLPGILTAIFEYRETQLQPKREEMLKYAEEHQRTGDVRYLLRVFFEPNFRMYSEDGNVNYVRLHASYLTTHRPRGVLHPVDWDSPSTVSYRRAMKLMRHRLSSLGEGMFDLRIPSVGAMFLSGVMQHAARPADLNISTDLFFEDMLDMMVQAITVLPCPPDLVKRRR